jgi:Zn-dependent protease
MLWVAAAGPLSNLAMAILWAIALKIGQSAGGNYFAVPLMLMGAAGVFINVIFMVLNLLPLPPLDGGRILVSLLPRPLERAVARIEPYGFAILLVLLVSGALSVVLWPLIKFAMSVIAAGIGMPTAELFRLAQLL